MTDTDKYFEVAVVLTIPAPTYDEALNKATEIVEGMQVDAGLGVLMIDYYEHDNEGHRVVYLSSEKGMEDALTFDDEDQALAAASTTEIFDTGEGSPIFVGPTGTPASARLIDPRETPPPTQERANIEAAFDAAEDSADDTDSVMVGLKALLPESQYALFQRGISKMDPTQRQVVLQGIRTAFSMAPEALKAAQRLIDAATLRRDAQQADSGGEGTFTWDEEDDTPIADPGITIPTPKDSE